MSSRKRIVALLTIGVVLTLSGFLHFYFWVSRPIGHGPAGPAVPRQLFNQPWTTRPVLFVGLGDSVTAGFGARKGYSYFDRLIGNPADDFQELQGVCLTAVLPNLRTTNLSVSGSTSMEHAEKQIPRLATVNPEVFGFVVMTTGGNDLIHNYGRTPPREQAMFGATWEQARPWIEKFESRLETMVKQVNARFPGGCHIFLANIYDPTDGIGDAQRAGLPAWKDAMKILDAYNECIRRCAGNHQNVHLVDLHSTFLGHGIHCTQFWSKHYDPKDPHYWYYDNLEDPNERGYDVIRRLFLIEMTKVANQFN